MKSLQSHLEKLDLWKMNVAMPKGSRRVTGQILYRQRSYISSTFGNKAKASESGSFLLKSVGNNTFQQDPSAYRIPHRAGSCPSHKSFNNNNNNNHENILLTPTPSTPG